MNFLGIEVEMKNHPVLDPGFLPLSAFFKAHQKLASQPFALALERENGQMFVYETKVIGTAEHQKADHYFLVRMAKYMLFAAGGFRLVFCGDEELGRLAAQDFAPGGPREFDRDMMRKIYDKEFVVETVAYDQRPQSCEVPVPLGGYTQGCRIGFDAGGSDRKVSAVIDGESVYSEEVVWHPKTQSDPDYHFNEIVQAFKTAASKMPRVDAIGISSAGVYINNQCKIASLFIKVPEDQFKEKVRDIYPRAAKEIGDVPVVVANDGDVSALAGAMSMNTGCLMGIAMGTSEAAGYVNRDGNITGWINELAFAPVDANPDAMRDEWSGDIGCGVKYFSQDAVIKLAPAAGITLKGETPAECLKEVQELMEQDHPGARDIFASIGVYLAHALAQYSLFYELNHVLMLGRVLSGKGGDLILSEASRVLADEYPECKFAPQAPDEKTRRVGQSVAAASLPAIGE